LHIASELHRRTGMRNLCMAGGVALNSVANGLLARTGPFERIFVQPAANDSGQAMGLAYRGHLLLGEELRAGARNRNVRVSGKKTYKIPPMKNAFGGRHYKKTDIQDLLDRTGLSYDVLQGATAVDAAGELARSCFIGWMQGASEFGPRALGHRSILADPRRADTKDRLNGRVKFREPFRPFAPSVLKEAACEIFDLNMESPYMLLVAPVKPSWRGRIPAVVHVDGTARLQTVDRESDPVFHRLIAEFAVLTDVPLVLNTSFNLAGRPIVESPEDALTCFLFTDMDYLYIDDFKVKAIPSASLIPAIAAGVGLEVTSRAAVTGQSTLRFTNTADRDVSLDVPYPVPSVFSLFDGKRSITDACQSVIGECSGADETPISVASSILAANLADAVGAIVKRLLRTGVMTITLGDFRFPKVSERVWPTYPRDCIG
jgi:Carbamoyltransferase C-terminus/Carbamoyltransferase N-terminus